MLDIYSGHAYDKVYVGWYELCNGMMRSVSPTRKPVWLDEFGQWADMGHEELVRGTGRYGNYLAQAVAACMNAGVQNVMLWELFDQQYISPTNKLSNTPDNQDGWYNGVHRWGTCYWPHDTITEIDSITQQVIPITDTTYSRPSWYAFSMMSKYLGGRDGTAVYNTTSGGGLYLSAVKRSDGRWSLWWSMAMTLANLSPSLCDPASLKA